MGNGFFLDGGVNDDTFQVLRFDGFNGHCGVDGGFEQQLQAVFAKGFAEAANLCCIAGQAVLVVVHTAEVLPQDVFAPAHHQFFVAEVETVLEVQQADHQADRQLGSTGVAAPATDHDFTGAEHVFGFEDLTRAVLVVELGCNGCFDLAPGQPGGQHRQRVAGVDHGIDSAAEEVNGLHGRSLRKFLLY